MPESDITKMKVADLKRELKLRGLPITGNKIELQERLQTALIDGELSLEDTAISEDLLEDVLTDEEEKAILTLPTDENELLKSPTTELERSFSEEKNVETPAPQPKKIVLKRKNSITPITTETPSTIATNPVVADENRTDLSANNAKVPKIDSTPKQVIKVSALTLEERLEMRAKKFGIETNKINSNSSLTSSIGGGGGGKDVDPKQIETLKKRAERFGCVVAPAIAKIAAEEKLEKRKQRFGNVIGGSDNSTSTASKDLYAEKARLRLERFKTAAK